jgi:2-C-methyl-D-erythritol 2,4-cyclodiphosphate synthase
VRIGQGFDIHPFSGDPGRRLVLGGVTIEGAPGLVGHSDADSLTHALADALLGAAGLGDLGQHFPDTDPELSGIESLRLLEHVMGLLRGAGYVVVNADCTVMAEAPRLATYLGAMGEALGAILGAPVSVKATRGEGLGAIGRGEGVAALTVVLIDAAPVTS